MTSEPDGLGDGLRRVAARLDAAVPPTDLATVRGHPPVRGPRSRHLVAAAAVLVLMLAGAAVAVLATDRDDEGVRTEDPTTSTTVDPGPPLSYEGSPWEDLPERGLAVVDGDRVLLLDLAGTQLASFAAADLPRAGWDPAEPVLVLPGPAVELGPPGVAEADGCVATGRGGVRVAVCGSEQEELVRLSPSGERTPLAGLPFGAIVGRWRAAEPSPDGRWALGTFSVECEVPFATFVPMAGGPAHTADGTVEGGAAGLEDAPSSYAVTWTDDGRAVVQFRESACGASDPAPGTYLVDPDTGDRTLLRAGDPDRVLRWERRESDNDLDRAVKRARAELGLEFGSIGDWSATSVSSSLTWEGRVVGVSAASLQEYVPDGDATDAETAEVDGLPVTTFRAGGSDHLALTCDGAVWTLGGGPDAPAPEVDLASLRRLASALVPHLYCTVGDPPTVSR